MEGIEMKLLTRIPVVLGSVGAALALGGASFAPVVAKAPAATLRTECRERDPNLRAALRHLQAAVAALQRADRDSAGHRAKALDHARAAVTECRLAIQNDH